MTRKEILSRALESLEFVIGDLTYCEQYYEYSPLVNCALNDCLDAKNDIKTEIGNYDN